VEGHPPDDDPLVAPPTDETGLRGSIADGVKKALLAGVGALFLTEEGARRMAREWKLPKDLAAFIGQQAESAKSEILRLFADEVRRFLESESVRKEFWKALSENAIEIRAEVRFRPADAADAADAPPRPEISATVRPQPRPRKPHKARK
jgi:hypothetical protein